MKKILCSGMIVFMMLLSTNTNAQVAFGIKGGVDVTSIKLGHEVMTPSNKVGFFIGPTVKCTLPVVGLGFDASLLYEQKKSSNVWKVFKFVNNFSSRKSYFTYKFTL